MVRARDSATAARYCWHVGTRHSWRGATAALAALAALGAVRADSATELVLAVDPAASMVTFTLGATAHTVHGSFRVKGGEIRFDSASGNATGDVIVDATSGVTGNASRDRTMHGTVLESAKYPEIRFAPARVDGRIAPAGASNVRVAGTLVLHGAAHAITVPLRVTLEPGHFDAVGSFLVPYVAWGLRDPSFLVLRVAKEVEVSVRIRGSVRAR